MILILILYSLFGFEVILIERQSSPVAFRESDADPPGGEPANLSAAWVRTA